MSRNLDIYAIEPRIERIALGTLVVAMVARDWVIGRIARRRAAR